jgi:hypothetical protein
MSFNMKRDHVVRELKSESTNLSQAEARGLFEETEELER